MAYKRYTEDELISLLGFKIKRTREFINHSSSSLMAIYTAARNKINNAIERESSLLLSDSVKRYNNARGRRFVLSRLVNLQEELKDNFAEFEKKYKAKVGGYTNIIAQGFYAQQLRDVGSDGVNVLGGINLKKIEIMNRDSFSHIAKATTKMRRDEVVKLRAITKRVMTEAAFTGETRQSVSRSLGRMMNSNARFRFIDKSGAQWTSEAYFNMLGRTVLMNAARTGYIESMSETGYDVARVSMSGNPCPGCRLWENRIISVFGKTPGLPTLEEAKQTKPTGLFHPNCVHSIISMPESEIERKYGADGRPKQGFNSSSSDATNSELEWRIYRRQFS